MVEESVQNPPNVSQNRGGAQASQVTGSSAGSSATAVGGTIVNVTPAGATEDVKDKALELMLARLFAPVSIYASKLPIIGSYFSGKSRVNGTNVDTVATETSPLLSGPHDPKAFATGQAKGSHHPTSVLSRLPDADSLDNVQSDDHGLVFKIFVECYVLVMHGAGWFLTHFQEHTLVIAPTVSLGHLSTTDLAASTMGTAVASMSGYSIVQGLVSSLDKILEKAPNRRAARKACVQAAVVTGVALVPITNLWTVHSATLFQQFGPSQEIADPASQYLRIAAAGLPGYAISEIAKRYLVSLGLSKVHTYTLTVTAPLNVALNYLLVHGPIPSFRFGFAGAPLSTVLSHSTHAIMLVMYILLQVMREEVEHLREQNIVPDEPGQANGSSHIQQRSQGHFDRPFFRGVGSLAFTGASGVSKSAAQVWSKDFGGVISGMLGPNALATQAVLMTTAMTLYQAPKALSSVSSERVKKWMGKGDVQRAKIAASVAFVATLGAAIVMSAVLAFGGSWGKLFNSDPVILQNVAALLPIVALFHVAHGVGAWADSSLGALGRTSLYPSLNAGADYFLGVPLGMHLAFKSGWGLGGLWVGLTISLACSCLIAARVLVKTNWISAAGGSG